MPQPQPLSAQTIAIVKATVPALADHGPAITRAMYARLFQDADIAALFNHSHQGQDGTQTKALANAVLAYARNIENLGALAPAVERIAQKHVGLRILPDHYPHVATALLGALQDVLGEAATPDILAAWGEAYWFLAHVLMAREQGIYNDLASAEGGWSGWRDFTVAEKIVESDIITSFVLVPKDGGPVLRHKAGQYLTFLLPVAGPDLVPTRRNYSISTAPNGRNYRISVKREERGAASSWLHAHVRVGDVLRVSPPAGDFFLPDQPQRPVVLLSGGVGLTPMVSMVETIAEKHPDLETHYIHGTASSATHAMDAHVRAIAARHPGIKVATFYSDPLGDDEPGISHDVTGLITLDWLRDNTPLHQADFYLCGPKPFLRAFVGGLSLAGVPSDRIHYEFFGPAEELTAA
ncbi:NO-inducible flavohemoprotein [Nitrospirillum iridis]|uniref:Flavohemoprotein n=1 Tax=Nitrospirillum iridis TaxID=765888 RepID=A0A7X0B3M2_9PROT|nr:NO-inducible flavohemoprotein [Nitrospirillum iridis]MBB6255123.1 nitric oxide dioxygenase [Nitrospirillum iridis]